jgi:hypothetical protein
MMLSSFPSHQITPPKQDADSPLAVLYATTTSSPGSKMLLESALAKFLKSAEQGDGKLLYSLYYEQKHTPASLDLAFNDQMLEEVETKWKTIVGSEDDSTFMQFEERTGMDDEDDDNE